jgi:hypothetical protein
MPLISNHLCAPLMPSVRFLLVRLYSCSLNESAAGCAFGSSRDFILAPSMGLAGRDGLLAFRRGVSGWLSRSDEQAAAN